MDHFRMNRVQASTEHGSVPIHLFPLNDVDNGDGKIFQKEDECFWNIMKPIIAVSQIFGNFPISGIYNSKPDRYVFKFPSLLTSYSLMIISLIGLATAATLNQAIHSTKDIFFLKFSYAYFYGYSFSVLVILFFKTSSWIKLLVNWQHVEEKLDNFRQTILHLRYKLQVVSLVFILSALIEHTYCYVDLISRSSIKNFIISMGERYLSFFGLLDGLSNSNKLFVGIFGCIIFTLATSVRNFCDLLIILVSIGLAERYKKLNEVVRFKISKNSTERINWWKIKNKYAIMNELVNEADNIVSPLILLSCCMNVYQTCVYTSEGIRSIATESKVTVYYFVTLFYTVFRIIAVMFSAAKIDDESNRALLMFTCCHPSVFVIEVIWIQQQLSIDKVSLTAMKCFSISRKFILAIAGTIVSYEIVYMQLQAHY